MPGERAAGQEGVSFHSYEEFQRLGNALYEEIAREELMEKGEYLARRMERTGDLSMKVTSGELRGIWTGTSTTSSIRKLQGGPGKIFGNSELFDNILNMLAALDPLLDQKMDESNRQEGLGNILAAYSSILESCRTYIASRNPRTSKGKQRLALVKKVCENTEREALLFQMRIFDVKNFEAGITGRQLLAGEMPARAARAEAANFEVEEHQAAVTNKENANWKLSMSVSEFRAGAEQEGKLDRNTIALIAIRMELYNRTLTEGDKGDPDGYYMQYLPAYLVSIIRACEAHGESELLGRLKEDCSKKPIPPAAYGAEVGETLAVNGTKGNEAEQLKDAALADVRESLDQFQDYPHMTFEEVRALSSANAFNKDENTFRELYNTAPGSNSETAYILTNNAMTMNAYARSQEFSDASLKSHRTMGILDRATRSSALPHKARFHRVVGKAFLQYGLHMDSDVIYDGIDRDITKLAGTVVTDAGFMSVGYTLDEAFSDKCPIMLTLLCDTGTPIFPTENHGESELILPRNTSYMVLGARVYGPGKGRRFEMSPYKKYDINKQESSAEKLREEEARNVRKFEGIEIFCKVVAS